MSDSTEKPKLGTRPPLGIKRTVETGKVKQSFSHGRSNTVVVEVKKRRILGRPGEEAPSPAPVAEAPAPAPVAKPAPAPAKPAPPKRAPSDDIMSRRELQEKLLREAEEARMTSLEEARRRDDHAARTATEDEKRRAEVNRKAETEAPAPVEPEAAPEPEPIEIAEEVAPSGKHEEKRFTHRPPSPVAPKRTEPGRPGRGGHDERRHAGKLTVTRALSGEDDNRARSLAALKRSREKEKRAHAQAGPSAKQVRDVVVPEAITIQELANRMAERGADLVKALFKMGSAVTLTQTIDQDTAELLVTEIGILVVAADDGLKPQTIEAINHTKAAGVPMIVAINKIDKPGANPQKVREELLQHEIIVEGMGGEVQDVEVSALKKTNLDKLLEAIALQAEILELKANPDRAAEGAVVEAKLDKGRGPLATVLVHRGTLRVGDIFVVGPISGKVRAMIDDKGRQVKEAGPSLPVEVLGLSGVPSAGDT